MQSQLVTAGNEKRSLALPLAFFGPVCEDDVLRMAELTREFHPLRLLDRVARDAGYGGLVLHPAWMSGLADSAIRSMLPTHRVKNLRVRHVGRPVHTDKFSFQVVEWENDLGAGEVRMYFQIKSQDGHEVAEGSALAVCRISKIR